MKCTIFKNIYEKKEAHYISIEKALDRIKTGASRKAVADIRSVTDKERQDSLKRNLPCVCFSGEFTQRYDEFLQKHSGFIVLDFDDIFEVEQKKSEISKNEFIYACWISPRNNGIKALVKIADGKKHRGHFEALRDIFPECDKSGVNESRVCYESYDPEIYLNPNASVFKKVKTYEKVEAKVNIDDENKIFQNIVKWLSNRGDAFVTGERNHFIFKLASACCRFGFDESLCIALVNRNFEIGSNKFSLTECERTIKSAYRASNNLFGTAHFDKDVLVDKTSKYEIQITEEMLDETIRPKDVIFGEDVKQEAIDIYENGYQSVVGLGIPELDEIFKFKDGEITLLSGYGNYGKSSFWGWKLLMRLLMFGEKVAFFTPEENSTEFYHNLTEMLLGCDCTPDNTKRPSKQMYEFAYDFISRNIFYVYPKSLSPTPEYIKERFLELIFKEKVKSLVIDPFNQLSNDYKTVSGRSDKYLEAFLGDCSRFAQSNCVNFSIIAHPVKGKKDEKGNYVCPDVFDIADGAMWNNKMDNILIYDRPNHQNNPSSDVCQLHSKKIRRQKMVGKKGTVTFNFNRKIRRFIFGGKDYMQELIDKSKVYVVPEILKIPLGQNLNMFSPNENNINTPSFTTEEQEPPF